MNFDLLSKKERHLAIARQHVDTETEEVLKALLCVNGIEFEQEVIIEKYRADFLLDGLRIIEVNGGYHRTKKQRRKDKSRATFLLKRGYEVTEVSNKDVFRCRDGEITLSELIKWDSRCISEKFVSTQKRVPKKSLVTEKANEARRKRRKENYRKRKEWLKKPKYDIIQTKF